MDPMGIDMQHYFQLYPTNRIGMEDTIGRPAETDCMIALRKLGYFTDSKLTTDFILEGCGQFMLRCPAGSDPNDRDRKLFYLLRDVTTYLYRAEISYLQSISTMEIKSNLLSRGMRHTPGNCPLMLLGKQMYTD